MEKKNIEQKAENLFNFVEDCFEKVDEGEELSAKEVRLLGIYYERMFEESYSEYFCKEEMYDDLSHMFDYIMTEADCML